MSTSTKVGIGILAGLAVYLVYRMFSGYNQAPVSASGTTASNLQSAGAPTAPQGQVYTVPTVAPSTGPVAETRRGAGHF